MEEVAKILERIWAAPKWQKGLKAARILDHWPNLVGEAVARAARPRGIARGVLIVEVQDHIWLQRLRFEEQKILSRLNEAAGETLFEGIKFVLQRGALRPARPKKPKRVFSDQLVRRFREEISVIEDAALREAFLRLRLTLAQKRTRQR